MNLSAKTEYACLAMMDLAAHFQADEPLRVREIAESHGIPQRFLVQILLQLKNAGLVTSTRGAAGGYHLLRDPAEITLNDVVTAVECQGQAVANADRPTRASRVLMDIWNASRQAQVDVLAASTLADLVDRIGQRSENMYYI